jgi:hypothetical protein
MIELEARLRLRLGEAGARGGPAAPPAEVTEAAAAVAAPVRDVAEAPAGQAAAPAAMTPEDAEMLPAEPVDADPDHDQDDILPPLEELTARVSPAVVTAMDELFRAKWTGVRRFPRGALKDDAG